MTRLRWCVAVVIGCVCSGLMGSVRTSAQDVGSDAQREAGKQLYSRYCAQCHGDKGDGEGYAAPHLQPRPRNFTLGKYKVRTTPNGSYDHVHCVPPVADVTLGTEPSPS